MNERSANVLTLKAVRRSFKQGATKLDVLRGISLGVKPGELVALVGPSGCGKSTLLHIAGLLERADGGEVWIDGKNGTTLSDDQRSALRRDSMGFVYQYHHLLREFSALENVVVPQMIAGRSPAEARKRAEELLGLVGLAKRATHRPAELSGGEQQRVAIARALANKPQLLLADEPTGNLDEHTADEVFGVLLRLVRDAGLGALIATHNTALAARMDRRLTLHEGIVQDL
jgi:lipoprotein-releasing system ATP-binding protein